MKTSATSLLLWCSGSAAEQSNLHAPGPGWGAEAGAAGVTKLDLRVHYYRQITATGGHAYNKYYSVELHHTIIIMLICCRCEKLLVSTNNFKCAKHLVLEDANYLGAVLCQLIQYSYAYICRQSWVVCIYAVVGLQWMAHLVVSSFQI